jgi:hypothetical protein
MYRGQRSVYQERFANVIAVRIVRSGYSNAIVFLDVFKSVYNLKHLSKSKIVNL